MFVVKGSRFCPESGLRFCSAVSGRSGWESIHSGTLQAYAEREVFVETTKANSRWAPRKRELRKLRLALLQSATPGRYFLHEESSGDEYCLEIRESVPEKGLLKGYESALVASTQDVPLLDSQCTIVRASHLNGGQETPDPLHLTMRLSTCRP